MDWSQITVLITGGTGSFGRKFTEVMLRDHPPRKLIIFSRDELKQQEMSQEFKHTCLRYFIGDVRDKDRLYRAFHGVDVVIHAAALKQVTACEYNPFEAVKTNVFGAQNVVDAAIDCGINRVMFVSTDKAVNPTNLYGATKLCAERMFVQGNSYAGEGGTRFSCCRYGNVVGSRGSVVPLFERQRDNGTVTITDPRMTRFWLTIDQGVKFVLKCINVMHGGEIFVPKLPSMSITELARSVAPGCNIEYIGIRPGEKLHEILISEDEARHTVELADMYVVQPAHAMWGAVEWADAELVSEDFRYASDSNTWKLSEAELADLIG